MLRVTVYENAAELRLHFEGRLAGPWVREAALCWEAAKSSIAGRKTVVDLQDVEFVDAKGEQLLAAMHHQGAELRAACAMMAHLIEEITAAERITHGEGCQWQAMVR